MLGGDRRVQARVEIAARADLLLEVDRLDHCGRHRRQVVALLRLGVAAARRGERE